jgi:hypothetical protein
MDTCTNSLDGKYTPMAFSAGKPPPEDRIVPAM